MTRTSTHKMSQSLRCLHTWSMKQTKGPTKNQTHSPTGWLRVWRMSLRRTKSAIISWDGSNMFLLRNKKLSLLLFIVVSDLCQNWTHLREMFSQGGVHKPQGYTPRYYVDKRDNDQRTFEQCQNRAGIHLLIICENIIAKVIKCNKFLQQIPDNTSY